MLWLLPLAAGLGLAWLFKGGRVTSRLQKYPPNSPEAIELFTEALQAEGLPIAWATHPVLHLILQKESAGGQVGIPNYTFGSIIQRAPSLWPKIWAAINSNTWRTLIDPALSHAPSSATGLGQLIRDNVIKYYPSGLAGIGDPLEEARGLLRYMVDRYGTPDNVHYGVGREGW